MSDRSGTLEELLNLATAYGARNIYTSIPCKVVKRDGLKVNVQILIKHVSENEAEEREVKSWPVIPGVPIEFPGAGDYRMTVPVTDGSNGTEETIGRLEFSHASLDKWLTGKGEEVDPEFDHDHALVDAVFVPGLRTFGKPYQSMPTDSMSIGSDTDGNGRIHFKQSEVQLGDGATKEVARKGDAVHAGTLTAVDGMGGTVQFIYTPKDGVPGAPSATATLSGGKITGGSGAIKAVD